MKISQLERIIKEEVATFYKNQYLRENPQADQASQAIDTTDPKDGVTNTYVELAEKLLKISRLLRQGTAQIPGLDPREIEEVSKLIDSLFGKSAETAIGARIQQTARYFDTQTKGSTPDSKKP